MSWMPDNLSFNNAYEYKIAAILNQHIIDLGICSFRNPDKFGADLLVYLMDFDKNRRIRKLLNIELERKRDIFYDYPRPPSHWTDWSFLYRKRNNNSFHDNDVYLICDPEDFGKIFWTLFLHIKKFTFFQKEKNNKREMYFRTPITLPFPLKQDSLIGQGYDTLCQYLSIKTRELKSRINILSEIENENPKETQASQIF